MNNFYKVLLLIIMTLVVDIAEAKMYASASYDVGFPATSVNTSEFPPIELFIFNLQDSSILKPTILLNNQAVIKLNEGHYTFDTQDLNIGENIIHAVPDFEEINGISTLDLIHLMRGLIVEDLDPLWAISADIDRSGSVTTKDLFDMRYAILGLKSIDGLGQPFLIEKGRDLTGLDMFAFNNDFEEYTFDGNSLDGVSSIELELFQYGNLSDAISDFHKSDALEQDMSLKLDDRSLLPNEVFEVVVSLGHKDMGSIAGAGWKFLHPDLKLLNVDAGQDNFDLLINDENSESTTFSFLPNESKKGCDVVLTFVSERKGLLSELIQLDAEYKNEEVSGDLELFKMNLEFTFEIEVADAFEVYPNPVSDKLSIKKPKEVKDFKLSIYNSVGQLILSDNTSESAIEINRTQLGISKVLIVHIAYEDKYLVKRIITSD